MTTYCPLLIRKRIDEFSDIIHKKFWLNPVKWNQVKRHMVETVVLPVKNFGLRSISRYKNWLKRIESGKLIFK